MAKAKFTPSYDHFKRLLIEARGRAALRQIDVARRLGVHQSYVSKIESGERRLDVVEFLQYAKALGADPIRIIRDITRHSAGS